MLLLRSSFLMLVMAGCIAAEATFKEKGALFKNVANISKYELRTEKQSKDLKSSTAILKSATHTESSKQTKATESPINATHSTTEVMTSTKGALKSARKQKMDVRLFTNAAGAAPRVPLDCDLPVLPRESRLWRANETHELNFPVMISEECEEVRDVTEGWEGVEGGKRSCPPALLWEGAADMQSGDVLIVRIAATKLLTNSTYNTSLPLQHGLNLVTHGPSVYKVNESGLERCALSDGRLLDTAPLTDHDHTLFTLYDRDLAQGVNLLIVVSEAWSQCIRLRVTVKSANCGESQNCSGKGVCYTNMSMDKYECACCAGRAGGSCEERGACQPSPCLNHGVCVPLARAHLPINYHCLCPYGFSGQNCEKDPCESSPCLNGGSCMGADVNGSMAFRCECGAGWVGARCERLAGSAFPAPPAPPAAPTTMANTGACAQNPCVNGLCVDHQEDEEGPRYRCFCLPGYTGEQCEVEYNECESAPCGRGGTCTDRVAGFSCACTRGYTGDMCQLKVDLCADSPCGARQCVDRGDSYTCECPHGFVSDDCHPPSPSSACDHKPCAHGGTCWGTGDTFYCSCRPGYTGTMCEEDFILESVVRTGADAVDAEGGAGGARLHQSLGLYRDRLHNVYIAAGTLGAALLIVAAVVTTCHCRVNKTYGRLVSRLSRVSQPGPPHHWLQDKRSSPASAAAPAYAPASNLDTADMYYTLDFSDSQSSPLIQ